MNINWSNVVVLGLGILLGNILTNLFNALVGMMRGKTP